MKTRRCSAHWRRNVAGDARHPSARALHSVSGMQKISIAVMAVAFCGCSAAQSALGVLAPKPAQPVVVITNTNAVGETKPAKSTMEKVGIVTTATVVGAAVGALVGKGFKRDVLPAAAVGAGVGVVTGLAFARN
jgi:hypothetical protein